MTIRREDLDAGKIDLSSEIDTTVPALAPVHPGQVLKTEFLVPLGLSVYALAQHLHLSRPRLNDIVLGRRAITADTALRLARYFSATPQFWLNLQTAYDLAVAQNQANELILRQIHPRAA